MKSVSPFPHWIIDNWCQLIPSEHLPPSDSPVWEVNYENDCESGKLTTRRVDKLPRSYGEVFDALCDDQNVREWSDVIGVQLENDGTRHGAGLHVMLPSGHLGVHLDFARHPLMIDMERRLSLVAFLHPIWKSEWGGQLLLCDPMGEPVVEVEPVPGRLVAWESSDLAYHGVRRIRPDADLRVSATSYLLAIARPQATRQRALFMPNRTPTTKPT